jgi:hypothetical protein
MKPSLEKKTKKKNLREGEQMNNFLPQDSKIWKSDWNLNCFAKNDEEQYCYQMTHSVLHDDDCSGYS